MVTVLALPLLAVMAWFAVDEGGYRTGQWLPSTLAVLGLVVVLLALPRMGVLRSRSSAVALGALAAYLAWSYLSVLWADAPGPALEGSHRTAAYVAAFAAFALLPWTARTLTSALAVWVGAVGVAAVVTLVRVAGTSAPLDLFNDGRLSEPLGYQNATAALWTAVAFTALILASRRELWPLLRPPLLAAAGVFLELGVLGQSRGWLVALPFIAVAVLVATPQRVRLLLHAVPVAAAVALALPALLEPYSAASGLMAAEQARALMPTLDPVVTAVALSAVGLLVAGALAVLVDRRVTLTERAERTTRRVGLALAVLVLLAGAGAAMVATDGDPGGRLADGWSDFKDFDDAGGGAGTGGNRFGSLGSSRYDFWRVASAEFLDAPITGLGQDNFEEAYILERRSDFEEPRWTHSLPLRLLTHTGLVGGLLFGVALAAVATAVIRRRSPRTDAAAAAAAVAPGLVWLIHGSVDWLWEFPGLSLPALAFAAAATTLGGRATTATRPWLSLRAAGVVAAALIGLFVLAAWAADRDVTLAAREWTTDPERAQDRLRRAEELAPLDTRPLLVGAIIAQRRGRLDAARDLFARAAEREPRDWFSRYQIGLIAGQEGDTDAARRALEHASRRNPRDPVILEAIERLDRGRPLGFAESDRLYRTRVQRRLGKPQTG